MNNEVNICCISDAKYMVPLIVMLQSIKSNKKSETHINAYCIVHSSLEQFWISRLNELKAWDFRVHILHKDASSLIKTSTFTNVSPAACLKFNIPDLLPDIDRVIYIDSDIIVQKDLTDFFNTNIKNNYVAAVREIGAELKFRLHELVQVERYFNSGVMLMNLTEMRKDNIPTKLIECKLSAPPTWPCQDQDALNHVLNGKIIFMPLRYNACLPLIAKQGFSMHDVNSFYKTEYQDWYDAQYDAVLLHLAGVREARPWQVVNGHYSLQWEHFYMASPLKYTELVREFNPRQTGTSALQKSFNTLSAELKCLQEHSSQLIKQLVASKNEWSKQDNARLAFNQELDTLRQQLRFMLLMPQLLKKYRLLKLKKFFSWGSRRKRYKQKIAELRVHIREYRQLLRRQLNSLS